MSYSSDETEKCDCCCWEITESDTVQIHGDDSIRFCKRCIKQSIVFKIGQKNFYFPPYQKAFIMCSYLCRFSPKKCHRKILISSYLTQSEYILIVNANLVPYVCTQCCKCESKIKLRNNTCKNILCRTKICQQCHQKSHKGECKKEDLKKVLVKCKSYFASGFSSVCGICYKCLTPYQKVIGCDNIQCEKCNIKFNLKHKYSVYSNYYGFKKTKVDISGYGSKCVLQQIF